LFLDLYVKSASKTFYLPTNFLSLPTNNIFHKIPRPNMPKLHTNVTYEKSIRNLFLITYGQIRM